MGNCASSQQGTPRVHDVVEDTTGDEGSRSGNPRDEISRPDAPERGSPLESSAESNSPSPSPLPQHGFDVNESDLKKSTEAESSSGSGAPSPTPRPSYTLPMNSMEPSQPPEEETPGPCPLPRPGRPGLSNGISNRPPWEVSDSSSSDEKLVQCLQGIDEELKEEASYGNLIRLVAGNHFNLKQTYIDLEESKRRSSWEASQSADKSNVTEVKPKPRTQPAKILNVYQYYDSEDDEVVVEYGDLPSYQYKNGRKPQLAIPFHEVSRWCEPNELTNKHLGKAITKKTLKKAADEALAKRNQKFVKKFKDQTPHPNAPVKSEPVLEQWMLEMVNEMPLREKEDFWSKDYRRKILYLVEKRNQQGKEVDRRRLIILANHDTTGLNELSSDAVNHSIGAAGFLVMLPLGFIIYKFLSRRMKSLANKEELPMYE